MITTNNIAPVQNERKTKLKTGPSTSKLRIFQFLKTALNMNMNCKEHIIFLLKVFLAASELFSAVLVLKRNNVRYQRPNYCK